MNKISKLSWFVFGVVEGLLFVLAILQMGSV